MIVHRVLLMSTACDRCIFCFGEIRFREMGILFLPVTCSCGGNACWECLWETRKIESLFPAIGPDPKVTKHAPRLSLNRGRSSLRGQ